MKLVDQIVFNDTLGDCFRACVASIFELPLESVPNFWEQTQEGKEFWELNDKWARENLGHVCIPFEFNDGDTELVKDILCIACAKSPRGKVDHAVVWKNGLIHDPHPSRDGLAETPNTFTLFIPLIPKKQPVK